MNEDEEEENDGNFCSFVSIIPHKINGSPQIVLEIKVLSSFDENVIQGVWLDFFFNFVFLKKKNQFDLPIIGLFISR